MPASYEEFSRIVSIAKENTHKTVERATNEIDRATKQHADATEMIMLETAKFFETGIVCANELPHGAGWISWASRSHFTWYKYFRKVAADSQRPFVWLWTGGGGADIKISQRSYTAPLIANFLLDGVRLEPRPARWQKRSESPVTYYKGATYWEISLFGEESYSERVEAWRTQCKTDPTMRKALRLA